MSESIAELLARAEAPEELERLFRADRESFTRALPGALAERPDALLLRAWAARLAPEAPESAEEIARKRGAARRELWLVVLLGLLAGLFVKLPDLGKATHWFFLTEEWFNLRNIALGPLGALLVYLLRARGWKPGWWKVLGLFALLALYLNLLPLPTWSDPLKLVCLYAPLLIWCLLCAAFAGGGWPGLEQRRQWVRFFGEEMIFSALLALGGAVLIGLSAGLFDLLKVRSNWIFDWMLPMGAAAIPVAAARVVLRGDRAARIMPLLTRIFAPLLLVVLLGYLANLAVHLRELFENRETLRVYNVLLLAVLGLAVFSLSGREGGGTTRREAGDWFLAALLGVTALLGVLGLAAIGQRIVTMGLTANRLAVLGSNLVVLGNLIILLRETVRLLRRGAGVADLELVTARYLPVYAAWALLVTLLFPLVF